MSEHRAEHRDKVWKVIRGTIEFTMAEVAVLTGENEHAVNGYIGQLRKCGYLRTTGHRPKPTGGREKVFRLIKNTGPRAPQWAGCIYDPNLNAYVGGCREHVA